MLGWIAWAMAMPDHVAVQVESGPVTDLAVAGDEAWVAWVTQEGEIIALDTLTWTAWNVVPESGATATAVAIGGGGAASLFAALDNNTIAQWTLEAGVGLSFAGAWGVSAPPLALQADDTSVYALLDDDTTGPGVMGYAIDTSAAKYESLLDLSENGFEAMGARVMLDGATGARTITYLYVVHGGAEVSRVSVSESGLSSISTTVNEGAQDLVDLWVANGQTTWFANQGNFSLGYLGSDSAELDITFLTTPDVGDATAVGGWLDEAGWFALAAADGLHLFSYTSEGTMGDEERVFSEGADASRIASIAGYGLVGGAGGLQILTDRPWVEITAQSATTVSSADSVTLTFTSDTPGDWEVYRQAVGSGAAPVALDGASGTIEAGATATATFTLPASDDGGDVRHLLEVRVTAEGGATGRDGTYADVDEVPTALTLSGEEVTFGDRMVRVRIDALDAAVADAYQVWISTEPFEAGDYETGGPAYVGPDRDPGELRGEPDAAGIFDCPIPGLTNGQVYYVAVRAYDGAQEGGMSNVYSVTPQETYSVSQRLGVEGWCGLSLPASGWLAAGLAGAVALGRRRGGGVAALLGLGLIVGAAAPAAAYARPHEDDLTPRSWNFELRYGPFLTQSNAALTDAFGASDNRLLRAEIGWTRNLVEVDLNFGLYSDSGGQATETGETSSDEDTLNAVPLALDATLRLDFFKEQPIVPFARAGVDYWIWNETWVSDYDDDGGGETTAGSPGWHWGAGLYLLLDPLDQASASRLETVTGVNDTYLVAEYRQTYGFGADTLDFTSTELTFGLKFDY